MLFCCEIFALKMIFFSILLLFSKVAEILAMMPFLMIKNLMFKKFFDAKNC
jgi:hypothetical protein